MAALNYAIFGETTAQKKMMPIPLLNFYFVQAFLDDPIETKLNINVTMIYDYKEIQILDLAVYVENGFLKTKSFF